MVRPCDQFRSFLLIFLQDEHPCRRCRARGCSKCLGTGVKQTDRRFRKRPWTTEEDAELLDIIERRRREHARGRINFVEVSREFRHARSIQSIRERYRCHLKVAKRAIL